MSHPGLPLAVALFAAPFVAVLQSKAMAPLALIPMTITLALGWRAGWRPGTPQGSVMLFGLMLAGWGAVTSLWAPDPGRAALLAVTLAAMMLLAHAAAGAAQGARKGRPPYRRIMFPVLRCRSTLRRMVDVRAASVCCPRGVPYTAT